MRFNILAARTLAAVALNTPKNATCEYESLKVDGLQDCQATCVFAMINNLGVGKMPTAQTPDQILAAITGLADVSKLIGVPAAPQILSTITGLTNAGKLGAAPAQVLPVVNNVSAAAAQAPTQALAAAGSVPTAAQAQPLLNGVVDAVKVPALPATSQLLDLNGVTGGNAAGGLPTAGLLGYLGGGKIGAVRTPSQIFCGQADLKQWLAKAYFPCEQVACGSKAQATELVNAGTKWLRSTCPTVNFLDSEITQLKTPVAL